MSSRQILDNQITPYIEGRIAFPPQRPPVVRNAQRDVYLAAVRARRNQFRAYMRADDSADGAGIRQRLQQARQELDPPRPTLAQLRTIVGLPGLTAAQALQFHLDDFWRQGVRSMNIALLIYFRRIRDDGSVAP